MIPAYDYDFFVRERGKPVDLRLDLRYGTLVCHVTGVNEDVAGGHILRNVIVRV